MAGLCERLRARCNDIVQRSPNISYDELRVELAQEERSYFRNKQAEYGKQRRVPFVSPLMSATPTGAASAGAQAKVQANVSVDGGKSMKPGAIKGKCYRCGKEGHKEVDCRSKKPDKDKGGKKGEKKGGGRKGESDTKNSDPKPCYAFRDTGS